MLQLSPKGSIEGSQGLNILERHIAGRRLRAEYVKERVCPDYESQDTL